MSLLEAKSSWICFDPLPSPHLATVLLTFLLSRLGH